MVGQAEKRLQGWRPWCRDFDSKAANSRPPKVGGLAVELSSLRRLLGPKHCQVGIADVPHVVADLVLLHRGREVFERLLRVPLALVVERDVLVRVEPRLRQRLRPSAWSSPRRRGRPAGLIFPANSSSTCFIGTRVSFETGIRSSRAFFGVFARALHR